MDSVHLPHSLPSALHLSLSASDEEFDYLDPENLVLDVMEGVGGFGDDADVNGQDTNIQVPNFGSRQEVLGELADIESKLNKDQQVTHNFYSVLLRYLSVSLSPLRICHVGQPKADQPPLRIRLLDRPTAGGVHCHTRRNMSLSLLRTSLQNRPTVDPARTAESTAALAGICPFPLI